MHIFIIKKQSYNREMEYYIRINMTILKKTNMFASLRCKKLKIQTIIDLEYIYNILIA